VGRVERLPAIASVAAAFGAAYVLQGSLLGGAVIARTLRERLGLAGDAMTYLTMYGDRLGAAWREYCASLDAFGTAHPGAWDAVIGAADGTFAAVDAAVAEQGVFGRPSR